MCVCVCVCVFARVFVVHSINALRRYGGRVTSAYVYVGGCALQLQEAGSRRWFVVDRAVHRTAVRDGGRVACRSRRVVSRPGSRSCGLRLCRRLGVPSCHWSSRWPRHLCFVRVYAGRQLTTRVLTWGPRMEVRRMHAGCTCPRWMVPSKVVVLVMVVVVVVLLLMVVVILCLLYTSPSPRDRG